MNENNNCNEVTQTPPANPPTVIAPQSQSTISDFSPASFGRQQEHQAIVWVQHLDMARTKKTLVGGKDRGRIVAAKKKPRKKNAPPASPSSPALFTTTKAKAPPQKTPDVRSQYAQEKDLLKFCIPLDAGKNAVFQNMAGSLWGTVRHVDWGAMDTKRKEEGFQTEKYSGFQLMMTIFDSDEAELIADEVITTHQPNTYRSISRRVVICPLCFDNVDVPLSKAITQCGTSGGNSRNITQHRIRVHFPTDEFPNTMQKVVEESSSNTVGSASQKSQSSINRFAHSLPNRVDAKKAVRDAIFCCVNDLGFPASTVERPAFREMIRQLHTHATVIQPRDIVMSNQAIETMRVADYNHSIRVFSCLGENIRKCYMVKCGRPVPFATICHDIWQGKKKDVLGVTLTFCDPRNCELYRVPIGLIHTHGHSALQVCDHTHKLLAAFGWSQADLSASVNDNTAAAVLAGKYIVGTTKGGYCSMHKAELILKLVLPARSLWTPTNHS